MFAMHMSACAGGAGAANWPPRAAAAAGCNRPGAQEQNYYSEVSGGLVGHRPVVGGPAAN